MFLKLKNFYYDKKNDYLSTIIKALKRYIVSKTNLMLSTVKIVSKIRFFLFSFFNGKFYYRIKTILYTYIKLYNSKINVQRMPSGSEEISSLIICSSEKPKI